jgi:hypothetical protein
MLIVALLLRCRPGLVDFVIWGCWGREEQEEQEEVVRRWCEEMAEGVNHVEEQHS